MKSKKNEISVCISSANEGLLRDTITSLLHQADKFYLHLTNYSRESANEIQKIAPNKIEYVIHGGRGSSGKFYFNDKLSGYILYADEGIIYPKDYAIKLVDGIEKYQRKAIVSFHGLALGSQVVRYNQKSESDTFVHIAASGCSGHHSDTIKISTKDFPSSKDADLYFSLAAQKSKIPIVALSHNENWIKGDASDMTDSRIYEQAQRCEGWKLYSIKLVNQYPIGAEVDVVMLSYTKDEKIYEMTKNAISSLRNSQKGVKFNVYLVETNKKFSKDFPKGYDADVIIPKEEFNFNKFLNIGFAKCKSKYVVASNNDVVFENGWLSTMVNAMGEHNLDSACPFWKEWFEAKPDIKISSPVWLGYSVGEQVFGYCVVMKKEVLKTIGKFDEKFKFWFQDNDYAKQLQSHGFRHALVKDSIVNHLGGVSHKFLEGEKQFEFKNGMKEVYDKKYQGIKASAIITNWNESHVSVESARRLLAEGIEVIVVDNGSDDGSDELFKEFGSRIKYVRLNDNYGSSIARNLGACFASNSRTFLIDGDILYVPDTIRKYSLVMDMLPDAAIVGYFDYDRSVKNNGHWSGTLDKKEADERIGTITKINCWYPMAWTQYGLFRTDVLREVKFPTEPPFNSFGWGYEDDYFFYAMRAKGWKSYSVNAPNYYHDKNFGRRELKKRGLNDMFKERRKAFCERWGLSIEDYEVTAGWIEKKYINVNL